MARRACRRSGPQFTSSPHNSAPSLFTHGANTLTSSISRSHSIDRVGQSNPEDGVLLTIALVVLAAWGADGTWMKSATCGPPR
jgi:hypothetical protein